MRRLFWVALGATVGALVVRKLAKTAKAFTPQGIAGSFSESLAGLGETFAEFVADVREAMTEREQDLMAALSDDGGAPEKPAPRPHPR